MYLLVPFLRKAKENYRNKRFLSYEENLKLDRFARDFSEKWFSNSKFKDIFNYRGINLAQVISNGLDEYITWILKQYMVLKKILTKNDVKKVIIFRNGDDGVVLKGDFNDIQNLAFSDIAKKLCPEFGSLCKCIIANNSKQDIA